MILVNSKAKHNVNKEVRLTMKRVAKVCNEYLICDDEQPKVQLRFTFESNNQWWTDEGVSTSYVDYVWMMIMKVELGMIKLEDYQDEDDCGIQWYFDLKKEGRIK